MSDLAAVLHARSDGSGRMVMNSMERARMTFVLTHLSGEIELVIRRPSFDRSKDFNAYYWGVVLKLISEHTGEFPKDLHEKFKGMFGIGTTTNLSSKSFADYVECICACAAELNIIIPPPERVSGYERKNKA